MLRKSVAVSLCLAATLTCTGFISLAQGPPREAAEQPGPAAGKPWMNTALTPDQRADLLVKQLTMQEKIQLVHGIGWGPLRPHTSAPPDNNGGAGEVLGIPRLGIPSLQQADSAVGVRGTAKESRYSTLLPSTLGATASWDPSAAHLYGDVIGRELRAEGFNQSIGGGVDIARDPRNGRLFEYCGEDPVLAGTTVGNWIEGVQSNQVMADIKHYAMNDQETGRTVVNAIIDHKAMHESDLLAFEIGIRIGHPSSVMCSYNKVNGDWSCENDYLLNTVLKGQWHFPGFVVSDWGGTHSTVKAALAGLDQEQPGQEYFGQGLMDAVNSGKVPASRLDDMVHRLLRSMFEAGVIDHPPMPRFVVDPFKGRDDAQHIAEESIVLLRNQNNLLPLNANAVHSIAVIGAHADQGVLSGGGSAQVDAPNGNAVHAGEGTQWGHPVYFPSAPLKYIQEHAPGAQVRFDPGTDLNAAAALAKQSDVAIVFADQFMSEGGDEPTLALPNDQDALIQAVAKANPRTVVVLITGNPVTMPWVDNVAGIMEAWYPGIGGGQAIANLLFGTVNPSAKLPVTFAKSDDQLPHHEIFGLDWKPGMPQHWMGEDKKTTFPAEYTEGARAGYKWFESEHKQPLFPFGFGLSYTTYSYSDLHVEGANKTATLTLQNTGQRAGTEVAQVYVRLPRSASENYQRLAGWQRVELAPGERKTVTIKMEPLALAVWNDNKPGWEWPSGEYTVSAGSSSEDLPLTQKVALP